MSVKFGPQLRKISLPGRRAAGKIGAKTNYLKTLWNIPLPAKVIALLAVGLFLGVNFPRNSIVKALYLSGTYFPKLIVTLAAFLIFNLLAAATAKVILFHRERAGLVFRLVVAIYIAMGAVSLVYATAWIAVLADIPFSLPGVVPPTPVAWIVQISNTFANVLWQQPLLQVLVGAVVLGWLTASVASLNGAAYGFIAAGDLILSVFRRLLWYYPLMIGTLAIGIPLKFGLRGLALYEKCVLWDMIVICVWCLAMIVVCKTITRRSWRQILSYYATVWPTGFGTGGSYDTLAVNLVSAEQDLGLDRSTAEISIVFGTVLNKNCATMSVLIVTVIAASLLSIRISLTEIVLLIPPVIILGLESPGIPGGAGYFMSPIIAVLLHVPDPARWVATFVALYSGLIPMFSTAGNTTGDGVVGAILQDCFWLADKTKRRKGAVPV